MTREEQLQAASMNDANYVCSNHICDIYSFRDGVRWADANPNWRKYPDEKPSAQKHYLIVNYNTVKVGTYYPKTDEWFDYEGKNTDIPVILSYVRAWMELPNPPQFE